MKERSKLSFSLSNLTIAAVFAATIAAVACSIGVFASVYSSALKKNAEVNAEQTVNQAAVAVNNTVGSMKSQLDNICALIKSGKSESEIKNDLKVLLGLRNDIVSVTVYSKSGEILLCASDKELKSNILRDLSFNKENFDSSPKFSLSQPHIQSIFEKSYPWVVTAAVKTDEAVLGNGTYITADFNFSGLADYIDQAGIGQHGYCFIADGSKNIIYHPAQQMIFSNLRSEDLKSIKLSRGELVNVDHKITVVSDTSYKYWKIIGISYTDELEKEKNGQIFISILIAVVCCVVFAAGVLLIYQKIVTKPVKKLIKAMKTFESKTSSFEYDPKDEPALEISELNSSFCHMSERIKELMEQVRKEEKELRITELKALQAQINPHFLYNTLDSISWMCESGNTKDAAAMVSALAKLFRISISRGKELIPIKDELNHAKSYLIIQTYRYKNQFTYKFEVEEGLENYLCNKITIQPLIENAIYHGLDRMVDEGEIVISVFEDKENKDDIIISVADNGVGMTDEQCRSILKKNRSDSSGIGVKNVNDRLKIYFGENYGISIKSELDVGTTVTVKIPKIKNSEDINI